MVLRAVGRASGRRMPASWQRHPRSSSTPSPSQPDVLQTEWLSELKKQGTGADHRISESELGQQGRELLQLLGAAVATGTDIQAEPWRAVRDFLERLSRSRAQQGFTSSETATFVFSLKRPLFARIRAAVEGRHQPSATRPGRPPS